MKMPTTSKPRKQKKANQVIGDKMHSRGRQMSPALIYVLNHPIRRQILRSLSVPGSERSPSEMVQTLTVGLTNLGFHARTLYECGVVRQTRTRQARGATEHFYASNVSENELVMTILSSTEEDDCFLRKPS